MIDLHEMDSKPIIHTCCGSRTAYHFRNCAQQPGWKTCCRSTTHSNKNCPNRPDYCVYCQCVHNFNSGYALYMEHEYNNYKTVDDILNLTEREFQLKHRLIDKISSEERIHLLNEY